MYKKPVYWTDLLFISFLQRVILIHCYLYYEKNTTLWTDKKYDEVSKQLVEEQNKHNLTWIKQKTQYGYCFYDFDGSTGFDLFSRLKEKDRNKIIAIANSMTVED